MILEAAILTIKPGTNQEYEEAFQRAQEILPTVNGYISHQLQACIEKPERYVLLIWWETLEAHTIGFRGSPQYQEWSRLLHHFYEWPVEVLHYQLTAGNALDK